MEPTNGKPMLCPRCKVPMVYMMEVEKLGNERRLTRYYRCPACGTRVIVERLLVRYEGGLLRVYAIGNGARQVIYGRPAQPKKLRSPRPRRR